MSSTRSTSCNYRYTTPQYCLGCFSRKDPQMTLNPSLYVGSEVTLNRDRSYKLQSEHSTCTRLAQSPQTAPRAQLRQSTLETPCTVRPSIFSPPCHCAPQMARHQRYCHRPTTAQHVPSRPVARISVYRYVAHIDDAYHFLRGFLLFTSRSCIANARVSKSPTAGTGRCLVR